MKKLLLYALVLCLLLSVITVPLVSPARADAVDVTKYTYEIVPILSPFCYCVYVRTENPDPMSFRFLDPDSAYGDSAEYRQDETLFSDVRYEDASRYRVKGGYIFTHYWNLPDGGSLVLQRRTTGQYYDLGGVHTYTDYVDTDVTVTCPRLKNGLDVLIERYTNSAMSFWEKLDAVQQALNKLAVYPRAVQVTDSPSTECPWPYLATSPYAELTLNEHYEMFSSGKMLLQSAYPYILDSLGVPGTLAGAARRFDPNCTVEQDDLHWKINVTWNGETRSYGGAGAGGYDPIGSDQLDQLFLFDGSDGDWFGSEDTSEYCDKLLSYREPAEETQARYRDQIAGNTFRRTVRPTGGTWIRTRSEYGYTTFSYLVPNSYSTVVASDAWVDGRYIDRYECFVPGEVFADHAAAGIVVPGRKVTYWGEEETTQAVLFSYCAERDRWEADVSEFSGYGTTLKDGADLPAEWYLTRAQVQAMSPDRNTMRYPESGLIYDGKSAPGTPFSCVTATLLAENGKSGPEGKKVGYADKGQPYTFPDAAAYFTAPETPSGQTFKAWRVDGAEYPAGNSSYTPAADFTASAVWSTTPEVALSAENFPDENFRAYAAEFDKDGNGVLSGEEIQSARSIMCINLSISSLKGIEYFVAATEINCAGNNLTSLDVSKNTALKSLSCNSNRLASLNLSANTALTRLDCSFNRLSSLNLSRNTKLSVLNCGTNQLTSLDLSHNPELARLSCASNMISELDLTACPTLAGAVRDYPRDHHAPSSTDSFSDPDGVTYIALDAKVRIVAGDVVSEQTSFPGDVNGDGTVDGRDAVRLMKYLAGEIDPETQELYAINEEAADLTCDGFVDSLDLLRLVKFLGGELPAL